MSVFSKSVPLCLPGLLSGERSNIQHKHDDDDHYDALLVDFLAFVSNRQVNVTRMVTEPSQEQILMKQPLWENVFCMNQFLTPTAASCTSLLACSSHPSRILSLNATDHGEGCTEVPVPRAGRCWVKVEGLKNSPELSIFAPKRVTDSLVGVKMEVKGDKFQNTPRS